MKLETKPNNAEAQPQNDAETQQQLPVAPQQLPTEQQVLIRKLDYLQRLISPERRLNDPIGASGDRWQSKERLSRRFFSVPQKKTLVAAFNVNTTTINTQLINTTIPQTVQENNPKIESNQKTLNKLFTQLKDTYRDLVTASEPQNIKLNYSNYRSNLDDIINMIGILSKKATFTFEQTPLEEVRDAYDSYNIILKSLQETINNSNYEDLKHFLNENRLVQLTPIKKLLHTAQSVTLRTRTLFCNAYPESLKPEDITHELVDALSGYLVDEDKLLFLIFGQNRLIQQGPVWTKPNQSLVPIELLLNHKYNDFYTLEKCTAISQALDAAYKEFHRLTNHRYNTQLKDYVKNSHGQNELITLENPFSHVILDQAKSVGCFL